MTVSVVRSGNAGVVDFEDVASFEIVIPGGGQSAEGTFTLVPEDDRVDEADETVEIAGTSDLPVTSASVTITDNDATARLINLAAAPARVSEHDGSTRVTVTAALDGGARTVATPVTVSVTGSGNPGAVDFAPVSDFRITIAGGATRGSGTFVLVPDDDDDDEVDETLDRAGGCRPAGRADHRGPGRRRPDIHARHPVAFGEACHESPRATVPRR